MKILFPAGRDASPATLRARSGTPGTMPTSVSGEEARAAEAATGTSQERRFTLELEFLMSLANPRYLHRTSSQQRARGKERGVGCFHHQSSCHRTRPPAPREAPRATVADACIIEPRPSVRPWTEASSRSRRRRSDQPRTASRQPRRRSSRVAEGFDRELWHARFAVGFVWHVVRVFSLPT